MLYCELYEWQKKIVDEYYERNSFGLFLDMGLGKTPISLSFAEKNKCTKIVIVTLNSKALEKEKEKGSWLNWCNKLEKKYLYKSKKDFIFSKNENEVLLINYESLFSRKNSGNSLSTPMVEFIKSCKNHNVAVILDESHKLKNIASKQTKAVFKMYKLLNTVCNSVFIWLLSGTPFTQGYIDLYSQLKLLGYNKTKTNFVDEYCVRGNIPGLLGWQQPIVGYRNLEKLYELVHSFALTVKSKEVLDLPEQITINHVCEKSEIFASYCSEKLPINKINKIAKKLDIDESLYQNRLIESKKVINPFFRNLSFPNFDWLADTPGNFWLRSRQLSIGFQGNSSKYVWLDYTRLEKLKEFLKSNEDNYVLFYNYTPELLEIYEICEELKYNIDIYSGDIKSTEHYERFCENEEKDKLFNKKNIILANFASGSTGKNWQEYKKCIIFSIPIYSHYEQAVKRIHRIGTKDPVYYHVFSQDNSLDQDMFKCLNEGIEYNSKLFEKTLKI